jgi:hypothetical protein
VRLRAAPKARFAVELREICTLQRKKPVPQF